MSLAVRSNKRLSVSTVMPAAKLRSPSPSASVSALMVVIPWVHNELPSITPLAARSVSEPAPVMSSPPTDCSVNLLAESRIRSSANWRPPRPLLSVSPLIRKLPRSVVTFPFTKTCRSAWASNALNVEVVAVKVTSPAASRVSVPLMESLAASEIPSTVMSPAVRKVSSLTSMFCNSVPSIFNPSTTDVFPRPMPLPLESTMAVNSVPPSNRASRSTSAAVIFTTPEPGFRLPDESKRKVPAPSWFVSALIVTAPVRVVTAVLIVTPSTALIVKALNVEDPLSKVTESPATSVVVSATLPPSVPVMSSTAMAPCVCNRRFAAVIRSSSSPVRCNPPVTWGTTGWPKSIPSPEDSTISVVPVPLSSVPASSRSSA